LSDNKNKQGLQLVTYTITINPWYYKQTAWFPSITIINVDTIPYPPALLLPLEMHRNSAASFPSKCKTQLNPEKEICNGLPRMEI
jgi:hypothetical protein